MAGSEMPRLVVDVVIPSGRGVVLIRRASDPFEGRWPLPGGFAEIGETVESSAAHEAAEKTGLAVELARLVGVYPDPERVPRTRPPNAPPERDPRGHNGSVAFLARVVGGDLVAATDAAEVAVLDPGSVELAFSTIEASSPTRWEDRRPVFSSLAAGCVLLP